MDLTETVLIFAGLVTAACTAGYTYIFLSLRKIDREARLARLD